MVAPKFKFGTRVFKRTTIFTLALVILFGTFVWGYGYGQKGKSIFGLTPTVTNTEVGMPSDLDFSLYWQAWNKLKSDSVFNTDTKLMIYNSISGLLSSVNDPYTVFFTPDDNKLFQQNIQGQFD
ncbi:MAG: hypothetical protein Q7S80_01080, partial [bacterium]|nr:hypothetical protein [bacterium]